MDKEQQTTRIGERMIPKFHPHDYSKDIEMKQNTTGPVATGRSRLNDRTPK